MIRQLPIQHPPPIALSADHIPEPFENSRENTDEKDRPVYQSVTKVYVLCVTG